MKKQIFWIVLIAGFVSVDSVKAQSIAQDIEQLTLDYEKLAQMKSILKEMYKGYEVVSTGYSNVKNVTQGNFNLHQAFLNGLLAVSPAVRNYKRITDIINNQAEIIKEYKEAYAIFKKDPNFNFDELNYISGVYNNLINESVKNLDALTMVITAGKLRMSDDERLKAIDKIADDTGEKLSFLRSFNNDTQIQALQRAKERNDLQTVQQLYGVKQ
jgi:hypothetical protein